MAGALKVAVTGASSGIGRATAIELARRGHLVFAAARREEVLADLAAATPNIQAVSLDVTDADSVRRAWAKIEASTGGARADGLGHNPGVAPTGPPAIPARPEVPPPSPTTLVALPPTRR